MRLGSAPRSLGVGAVLRVAGNEATSPRAGHTAPSGLLSLAMTICAPLAEPSHGSTWNSRLRRGDALSSKGKKPPMTVNFVSQKGDLGGGGERARRRPAPLRRLLARDFGAEQRDFDGERGGDARAGAHAVEVGLQRGILAE